MTIIHHITDPADQRVARFRNLRDGRLRAAEFEGGTGSFVCEGSILVRRLLASDATVLAVLAERGWLDRHGGELGERAGGAALLAADRPVMEAIVGFEFHRGVMACAERPPARDAGDLIAQSRVLVVLEDLSNQDNVGAVFRNAAALVGPGAGVLLSPRCCDPLYRKALRVSAGAALDLPFARLEPWPEGLRRLAAAGYRVLLLTPHPDALPLDRVGVGPESRVALVLGAEGPGLSPAVMGMAGAIRVRIPMSGWSDSLNVATAAAIVLARLGSG